MWCSGFRGAGCSSNLHSLCIIRFGLSRVLVTRYSPSDAGARAGLRWIKRWGLGLQVQMLGSGLREKDTLGIEDSRCLCGVVLQANKLRVDGSELRHFAPACTRHMATRHP